MKFNNYNVQISRKAIIGNNVRIGDNTIIYDNVTIGDNTVICNDCVLGEPLNNYYSNSNYENPPLLIGANSLIRSHSIFYAGSSLGDFLQTGHRVTVREYTKAAKHCSFGSYTDIQGYCKIGNYVRMHSYVNIGQQSEIGDFVFLYPFSGAVLLPGTVIGANSLVGANSTVEGYFEDDSFISGSPAKRICTLSKAPLFDLETKKRHYPWPYHFKRGMPWENCGFENWKNKLDL